MDELVKKQILLDELLESVKQCQIKFGGKSELATEAEDVISDLCKKLEAILNHGLKTQDPLLLIKEKVTNNIQSLISTNTSILPANNFPQNKSPWSFIRLHLNRHELERYMLLKQVKTDAGRARAWLRSSLNEHSLERYFHMMTNDTEKLQQFYDPHAFMIDQERNSMLANMAAGVGSILFAIKIDNEALNYWSTTKDCDVTDNDDDLLAAKKIVSNPEQKPKKSKKKGSSQVISFDDDEIKAKLATPKNSAVIHKPIDKTDLEQKVLSLKAERAPSPLTYNDVHLNSGGQNDTSIDSLMSKSPTDGMSVLSIDTSSGHDEITKLTPMKNSGIGALIPISPNGHDDVMSDDSMSIKSFEDQDYASAMSSIIATPQPPPITNYHQRTNSISSVASAQNSTLSREDLKQALLSVMERKEELQEQCHSMKKLLEQESSTNAGLKQELSENSRKAKESTDKMQARINSISRENELLKHQLKKYVGAVQKLRDGPQAHETLAHLEGQENKNANKYVDYHFEASEYEKKLIQVAEMHGELLEFNEHLQKLLHSKDGLIKRLRHQLVDLRGPLPDEEDQDDTISIISEVESNLSLNTARSLINIWVPSVFLSGNGNSTHHVYQVYLRIRDEEWNIYRRYSEFYALHKDLQKKDKLVAAFDFPPKKTVGNKAEKFVEDRRKRLQSYLRQIVNLMVQTNMALQAKPDKEQVILLMPFFAENSHLRSSATTSSGGPLPAHQRPPLFQRRRTSEQVTQLAI